MPTITIHVSEELNERLAEAAQTSASYAEYLRSGVSVPLAEVREYLENRIAGKAAQKPAFRKTRV